MGRKANSCSFEPTCASNECAFAGSWRDVPYKYAALRVLTQFTTSLKAGMSDRAPLRFPHLSFIRLEPYPACYARHLPHAGNAIKLSGRTFLAPHRGSCPKGLCKRTGFLGVKRRENPVRRHFERSEMRGLRSGIACKCWNIDSIGLFNIARYTASMPLLPSALPPKGEARRYVANDFVNLIAFPTRGRL